jgi:hypothetical protein
MDPINEVKLSKLVFKINGIDYRANVDEDTIILAKFDICQYKEIAIRDRKREVTKWYIDHACGEYGFNPISEDSCHSCRIGPYQEFDPENVEHIKHSNYSLNLEKLLKIIDKKSDIFNDMLKDNFEAGIVFRD